MNEHDYLITSLTYERIKKIVSEYDAHRKKLIISHIPIKCIKKASWINYKS